MKSEPVTQEPLLIGELEAARLLNLHPKTLYTLRKRGQIPFIKLAAAVRYSPEALRAWITERSTPKARRAGGGMEAAQ